MTPVLLLAALQVGVASPPPAPTGDGVIEVVVTSSATHEPVRKANVSIFGPIPAANRSTDVLGKAVFDHLPDGQFTVQAEHPNYPAPRQIGAWRQKVSLEQVERKRQVAIAMNPAASVSGRVVDEDGEPLSPCNIQAIRRDAANRRRYTPFGNAQTKPTGEYRMFNLVAGRYYLVASCQKQTPAPHPLSDQAPQVTTRYLPVVYPGAPDFASATTLDLAPGSERSGVDFRMSEGKVGSALVKVLSTDTQPGVQLQVVMSPVDPTQRVLFGPYGSGYNPKRGGYLFDSLPPGAYDVEAYAFVQRDRAYGGRASLEVEAGKVAEVSLPVGPGADLAGSLEMEDGSSPNSTGAEVFLQPADDNPLPANTQPVKIGDGGSFVVHGLLPRKYIVRVFNVPSAGFVKSVSLPDREISGGVLDFTSGVSGPLRIVAGTRSGAIEGNLIGDPAQHAPPGVFLVHDSPVDDEMRGASVQDSHFRFPNVPPGKYRLLAIGGDPMGMNPEMVQALSTLSQAVEVEEGATVTVDVKIHSAGEVQKALAAGSE